MNTDFSAEPLGKPSTRGHWFERGPSGRTRTTSVAVRFDLETFSRAVRDKLGGVALQVDLRPYRHAGKTWWCFDAVGPTGSLSLTFAETGKTALPTLPTVALGEGTGEVADAVDAHYLFEFMERELSTADSLAV